MSNKHGNPVFSPAMSSVPNCTEKCQKFRFVHQFTCMVAGMTGSGKTVWVKSLLQQAQKVIHLPPERAVWCYSQWQPAYTVFLVTVPNIEFVKGIPSDLEYDTFFDINRRNQEKIRGQRGTLPDQALGYVKFGKVIFRRPFATEV